MFPEGNKQAIDIDPVFAGQPGSQRLHGLLGRRGTHVSPSIGDTMDVDIYADEGLVARNAKDEMGALRANARERLQDFRVAGQLSAVLVQDAPGNLVDLGSFALMESARVDELIDLLNTKLHGLCGGAGARKEPARSWDGDFVIGADGDHAGNQLLEGRVESILSQLKHGCFLKGQDGSVDAIESKVDIERLFLHIDGPYRPLASGK
jgi:hypothetical protein